MSDDGVSHNLMVDNWESESSLSIGGYWGFDGDSDAVSFSVYGGGSDASVDIGGSDVGWDTDIDPMHAGLSQWNSDEGDEREEAEALNSSRVSVSVSSSDNFGQFDWISYMESPDSDSSGNGHRIFAELVDAEENTFSEIAGDYLARGFGQLLEEFASSVASNRGARPASASFVDSLPSVVITEEHVKDNLICAICKDPLSVGADVKQLPCTHIYHPPCILPWLTARNSCPLCRYELPTDKDYGGKRNQRPPIVVQENEHDDASEGSSDNASAAERIEGHESTIAEYSGSSRGDRRGSGWFFFAAAPVVGLAGIALALWLKNPLPMGKRPGGDHGFLQGGLQHGNFIGQRPQNKNRRWWSFF